MKSIGTELGILEGWLGSPKGELKNIGRLNKRIS